MAEFKIPESQRITTDADGNLQYGSMAAEGLVEIETPVPHGPHRVQRMHARDFPATVVRFVEESLKPNPYPKSTPMKSPAATFRHFIGAAQGLKLVDDAGVKHLEQMAREFEAKPERQRQEYFDGTLKPFVLGLKPRRRS